MHISILAVCTGVHDVWSSIMYSDLWPIVTVLPQYSHTDTNSFGRCQWTVWRFSYCSLWVTGWTHHSHVLGGLHMYVIYVPRTVWKVIFVGC